QNPDDVETLARLGVPRRKLRLLGNGIDLTRFDRATVSADRAQEARAEMGAVGPDDVVVGLVGRLVREKGYLDVFAAAEQLRARNPSVRIAVIGAEEYEKGDAVTPADRARADRA